MKVRVFVDTSAWAALLYTGDPFHTAAKQFYSLAAQQGMYFVTSDYVLDETLTLLRVRFGVDWAERFWHLFQRALEQGKIELLRVDERAWREALSLFFRYRDQKFSFTDCTSFALMRQNAISTAFAFDRHFQVAGFVVEPQ